MDEMTEVNAKRENLRLGIITLHNDPVPEMEIWKMCRVGDQFPHISIHTMRFFLSGTPMKLSQPLSSIWTQVVYR